MMYMYNENRSIDDALFYYHTVRQMGSSKSFASVGPYPIVVTICLRLICVVYMSCDKMVLKFNSILFLGH